MNNNYKFRRRRRQGIREEHVHCLWSGIKALAIWMNHIDVSTKIKYTRLAAIVCQSCSMDEQ